MVDLAHSERTIRRRQAAPRQCWQLESVGTHPLLARLFAARGLASDELTTDLTALTLPEQLKGADQAAMLLADLIAAKQPCLVIGDYDCDGATASALAVRALRAMGGVVDYLVPDRFNLGYGLSPALVHLAHERRPALLMTVDSGIADVEGVALARSLGMQVIITDHHLPTQELPEADAIVNPNQPGCLFPSKHLAGVGVVFYVMLALRSELRRRAAFADGHGPNLAQWLDLVALGTIADVVPLDHTNRILVSHGLSRIRRGKLQPGVLALFQASQRCPSEATSADLGYYLAPKLNAAGRLKDMSLGVACLLCDDAGKALALAQSLYRLNQERREIEAVMQAEADQIIDRLSDLGSAAALTLYDPSWHQGVVGILASRVKERWHRPVFAFAPAANGLLRGSGRSIAGVHLRDLLDAMHKRSPHLLIRFGGHAAAAGVTIAEADRERFEALLNETCREFAITEHLSPYIDSDGPLEGAYFNLPTARLLAEQVWGQGMPPPCFDDEFVVERQQLLQGKHLRLHLRRGEARFEAIYFRQQTTLPERIQAVYALQINDYGGSERLQLVIAHASPTA